MLEYILNGGTMMWMLLALSVIGLAIIIERWRVLKEAERETGGMREAVRVQLGEGRIEKALGICRAEQGPVAALLIVGLNRYRTMLALGKVQEDIEKSVARSMEEFAPRVLNDLEKRLGLLLMVGSVAPLVGMCGTVLGMIRAFKAMADAESLGGGVVAAGISEALITTAAGLLIAVPAVVFYYIFNSRVERYTLEIEESATELVDFIHLRGPVYETRSQG